MVRMIFTFILVFSIGLFGNNLAENDKYFKDAVAKSKLHNFGKGRVIAILDTGINDNNPELKGKVIAEYDFTINSTKAIDKDGHGTRMASIIASANDGKGITGIAYNAKLIDVKVVDKNGKIDNDNVIRGIEFAVKHGANVVNMSFSSGGYSQKLQDVITKYAKKGVIFVAAAGNNGEKALTYPAAYKGVIAVGALDSKTGKRAIYSNYGKWVDKWVEDGVWTYDGKKYSREYGTSEACAVVSGCIIKGKYIYNIAKQVVGNNGISNQEKKDFFSEFNFEDVFQRNDGKQYLDSLARYIRIQYLTRGMSKKIQNMEFYTLDKYDSISFSSNVVKIYQSMQELISKKMSASILLFDMFSEYAKLSATNDLINNNHSVELREIQESIDLDLLDDLIKAINNAKISQGTKAFKTTYDKISKLTGILLIKLNKGKTGPFARFVRKVLKMTTGDILSKDITKYRTKNLVGNFERAGKILSRSMQTLKVLRKILEFYKNTKLNENNIKYTQIYATDFLFSMYILVNSESFNNNTFMGKNIKTLINDSVSSNEKIKNFSQILSEAGRFQNKQYIFGESVKLIIELAGEELGNKSPVATVLNYLIGNDLSSASAVYRYSQYRNFLLSINDNGDAFTLRNNKKFGFINGNYIIMNIMANIAYKQFIKYSYLYLYGVFKNKNNWGKKYENITQISTTLNNIKFTNDTSKLDYKQIDSLASRINFMSDYVIDTIMYIPRATYITLFASMKKSVGDIKFLDEYKYFKNKSGSTISKINSIFVEDYNNMMKIFSSYEKILMDMYNTKTLYDVISKGNIDSLNDANKNRKFRDKIDKFVNEKFSNLNDEEKAKLGDHFEDLYYISVEEGIPLLTKSYIEKMNTPITRKDFMIRMMLALLEYYNPYTDADFLERWEKNNLDKYTDDEIIQKLMPHEQIWLMYGKYRNLIHGNNVGKLEPYKKITRKDAFTLYGRIIRDLEREKKIFTDDICSNNKDKLLSEEYLTKNKNKSYNVAPDSFYTWNVKEHILDFNRSSWNKFKKECPSVKGIGQTYTEMIKESIGNQDMQGVSICTSYKSGLFNGSLAKVTLKQGTNEYIQDEYRILNLTDYLTYYESSILAERLMNYIARHKPYNVSDFGIFSPELINRVGDYNNEYIEYKIKGCGTQSLQSVKVGNQLLLILNTNINRNHISKLHISWHTRYGKLYHFSKFIRNDTVESTITFKPYSYKETIIVPIEARVFDANGNLLKRKFFYIQVKPSDNNNISIDTNEPRVNLVAQYLDSEDKFRISWYASNTKNLKILYSFDQKNWQMFANLNLYNYKRDSYTKKIAGSLTRDTIYFKAISKNGTKVKQSEVYTLNYLTTYDLINNIKVAIRSLPFITRKDSVYLYWYSAKDPDGNHIANYYEVSYADNYNFDNAKIFKVSSGHTYTFNNLQEDKKYYFKVRAVNSRGASKWSDIVSTTIKLKHLPTLDISYQEPKNGALGVSKTPIFKWKGSDRDGDEIEYYIKLGTDPKNLKYSSDWIRNKSTIELSKFISKKLKPNTKYYWQVVYREAHHDKSYYGGEYLKSPIWNFTTENNGYDLVITNIKLESKIKPDSRVYFDITVKNVGNEVAERGDVIPYYIKGNHLSKFRYYKNSAMDKKLNPGESETLHIGVDFLSSVVSYNDIVYDNVLIDGDSKIKFVVSNVERDANQENNSKEYLVKYSKAENLPKISINRIYKNNFSEKYEEYQYNLGWKLYHRILAEDNLEVTKIVIEYKTDKDDIWHVAQVFENNKNDNRDYMYIENTKWQIPIRDEFVTPKMLLRVKAYNSSTTYSSQTTKEFIVYTNEKINLSDFVADKTYVTSGESVHFSWNSNGSSKTLYTIFYRHKNSNELWKKLDYVKGKTEKTVKINLPKGDYDIRLVSSYPAKIDMQEGLKIVNDINNIIQIPKLSDIKLKFDNDKPFVEFNCNGNYDKCIIYRGEDGVYTKIGEITSTKKFIDKTVEYNHHYSYKAMALKDNIKSRLSNEIKIDITIPLTKIEFLNKNNQILKNNSITLKYKNNENNKSMPIQYEILIGTNPKQLLQYLITDKNITTIENLNYATTYYVEIYPLDLVGNRLSSVPAKLTFTTGFDKRKIEGEIKVSIDEVAKDHISISWNEVKNADYYQIWRSEDGKEFEFLTTSYDTSFADYINIENGRKYRYIVKAVNDNDSKASKASSEVLIPSPIDPNADSDGDGIKDSQDAFPNNPNDWQDTDHDGIGDNADTDDDNDGISDTDEIKYGLNPLDPSDATQDADGDRVSNIDEINGDSNPTDANSIPKNRLTSIYFGKDKKITIEQEANITLIAEKELVNYPKNVKIAIDYENSTIDANDINISKGYNFKFENNSIVSHTLKFKNSAVCSDDLSSKVTFKIEELDSGLENSGDKQTIYSVCHKDLRVKVRFMQDGKYITPVIHDTTKPIIVKIDSNQIDGVTYDIKNSNSILLSYVNKLDKNSIEFNLNGIEDGVYDLAINITNGDEKLTIKRIIVVKSENKDTEQDSDNDGIVDSYDKVSEDNKIQTQLKGNGYLIEVRDGEKIALGNLALKLGEQKASIDVNKIKKPKNYKVKEVFDFRVSNLEKGESTYVVLPLKESISKNQKFVKYYESGDIKDFAIDAKNKIFTAKSLSEGLCPIPGSNRYKEGLNIGDNCIELLIEDGGANDQDNEVNGEVLDPNAIVEKEQKQGDDGSDAISSNNSHTPTPPETDCCGVTDYSFILLIVLLMLFRRENAKKV